MIQVGRKSKIRVNWKLDNFYFSKDDERAIQSRIAKKYGIPKEHVKIEPIFPKVDSCGKNISVSTDIIANIQKPEFQCKLFKDFLEENNIQGYDFDFIKKIDSEINSRIDYDVYDKFRRYSIKWVKWNNFLSYGEDNYFDFSTLKGLVLLNGDPANQSGKTTFAIDLLHFLFFGRTSKAATQDKIFNKHLPEATEVNVEGCIEANGEEYVIKRTLTRPNVTKRSEKSKTINKVKYYKVVPSGLEELEDYVENQQGENNVKTNKAIKEIIGNEEDFDMIMATTSSNLDSLIEKANAERSRLFNRWIGLLPIEQKCALAKEKYLTAVKPTFLSNRYDSSTLQEEINALNITVDTLKNEIAKYIAENDILNRDIEILEQTRTELLEAKTKIDEDVLKIDITTLQRKLSDLVSEGKRKRQEIENTKIELDGVKDINFSLNDFTLLTNRKSQISFELKSLLSEYDRNEKQKEALIKGECCPVCGKKFDNVDNSEKIAELIKINQEIKENGSKLRKELNIIDTQLVNMNENHELYEKRTRLETKLPALEATLKSLLLQYEVENNKLKEYNKNKEAIDSNNRINVNINNIVARIQSKRNTVTTNLSFIKENETRITEYLKHINERENMIQQLNDEKDIERNWKIYLDMVDKNGISKMVLRKTLPIINAQIARLLNDTCDFGISIEVSDRNEVVFYLVKDGVKSDLNSGSGFERTAAAFAIRAVLGNISTLPKSNIFICDEILGRVAKENYDNMRILYEKILENFDCIIQISHLEEIKDWHNTIITVKKEQNISKIVVTK